MDKISRCIDIVLSIAQKQNEEIEAMEGEPADYIRGYAKATSQLMQDIVTALNDLER